MSLSSDTPHEPERHATALAGERARVPRWVGPIACAALVAVGVVIRARVYAANKALWLDEAYLSLSILHRDYAGLLEPLEYLQKAPYLYLAAVRFLVERLGPAEYVLRLLPFVASIIALPLFYVWLRRVAPWPVRAGALAMAAVSQPLIYYAAEAKPYAVDVVAALAIWIALIGALDRVSPSRGLMIAAFGSVSVWLSFPAVFVIAGSGGVVWLRAAWRKDWQGVILLSVAFALSAASLAAYYALSLSEGLGDRTVRAWWSDYFMPLPPSRLSDAGWFVRMGLAFFTHPGGFALAGLGAFAFVLGWMGLWHRHRAALCMALAPLAVVLLGSGFKMYPFHERFLLFLAPPALWLAAEGVWYLHGQARRPAIAALLGLLLILQPAMTAARTLVNPRPDQGVRETYAHLVAAYRPGDAIYVHHWAVPSLRYLYERDNHTIPEWTEGVSARREWDYYLTEIDRFRGRPRAWFLFTTEPAVHIGQEEQFFVTQLNAFAYREQRVESRQSNLYLYDLSGRRFPTDKDD